MVEFSYATVAKEAVADSTVKNSNKTWLVLIIVVYNNNIKTFKSPGDPETPSWTL